VVLEAEAMLKADAVARADRFETVCRREDTRQGCGSPKSEYEIGIRNRTIEMRWMPSSRTYGIELFLVAGATGATGRPAITAGSARRCAAYP